MFPQQREKQKLQSGRSAPDEHFSSLPNIQKHEAPGRVEDETEEEEEEEVEEDISSSSSDSDDSDEEEVEEGCRRAEKKKVP